MPRRWHFVGLIVAFALVAAACSGGGDESPDGADGSTEVADAAITIALGSEPSTLDPQLTDDGGERAVNDNVYETLLARTPDGEIVPGLAAELPTQVDDETWEFKLREGISFHNGEPFNADAVVASIERIIDPKFNSGQLTYLASISGAEKVDDYTVHVTTNGPDALLPTRLYWAKIVPAEASSDPTFADTPAGTGPYKFVEWAKGDHITIERNDDYWGDNESNIKTVTFKFVEESGARLSGILSDEFDLMLNLPPEDVERAPNSGVNSGFEHPVFILNPQAGSPLADARVRQAMNLAIDKESLAENLFAGLAEVDTCQVTSPTWFGYNPNLEPYPFDLDQAKELVQEAGAEGTKFVLIGEAGRWLKDREIIESAADSWRQIGLDPQVQILEFGDYLDAVFADERPDSLFISGSNELLDADRLLSAQYHEDGLSSSAADPKLNKLIEDARATTDEAERQDLYNQATEIACDEAYLVFLLNTPDIFGMTERLQWDPRVDSKLIVKEMSVTG
ncbi:MAG: peptide/nickel transport system substrate-binding protein [Actinomycetota bacterium]|nr:peptide/nickel transport system substrate-binding protein [Actinomycetota bacterium]